MLHDIQITRLKVTEAMELFIALQDKLMEIESELADPRYSDLVRVIEELKPKPAPVKRTDEKYIYILE